MKTPVSYVSHSLLRFGHEDGHEFNSRRTDLAADVSRLAGNLRHVGLLLPLLTKTVGDKIYVVAGNRRLAAIRMIAEDDRNDETVLDVEKIMVKEIDSDFSPAEISLVENSFRVALHPVDRYEVFAALRDEGMAVDDIAERHQLKHQDVVRALALGSLSPAVRDAWRKGEISHDVAPAFTLGSHADQDKALKKTRKNNPWALKGGAHEIRWELGASDRDAARHVAFIGVDVYKAAGGHIVEDLFGENHVVSDPKLAKQLVDRRLSDRCDELTEAGWKWALTEGEAPPHSEHTWTRVRGKPVPAIPAQTKRANALAKIIDAAEETDNDGPEVQAAQDELEALQDEMARETFSDKQKAKAGCIVGLDHEGGLSIVYGLIRPDDEEKAPAKKTAAGKAVAAPAEEDAGPRVSNKLAQELSIAIGLAAGDALAQQPKLALEVLIAALLSNNGRPIAITASEKNFDAEKDFAIVPRTVEQSVKALAGIVAKTVEVTCHGADRLPLAGHKDVHGGILLEALDAKLLNVALRTRWHAEGYFASMAKTAALDAIAECEPKRDDLKALGAKPKAEVAAIAVKIAVKAKWLPPEMRVSGYDGPGAKAKKGGK